VSPDVREPPTLFHCIEVRRIDEKDVGLDTRQSDLNSRAGVLLPQGELEEVHVAFPEAASLPLCIGSLGDGDRAERAMKLPEEYWSRVESDPLTVPDHPGRQSVRALRTSVQGISDLIQEEQPERVLVWRGQADADYGLSSSLFRKALTVHSMRDLNEPSMYDLESEVIAYARQMGLGFRMTNLQLLYALQHYQLPTRLIDVSRNPMSALWFACSERPRKDGRLFLFAVPKDAEHQDDPTLQMVPWAGIRLSNWTNKVLLLSAPAANPRMAAQDGAFLVGGLARNYAGQQRLAKDKNGNWCYIPAEQIHEISELFIKFPLRLTNQSIKVWNSEETYGVTWRIRASAKSDLLEGLRLLGITKRTTYPEFEAARGSLDQALSV